MVKLRALIFGSVMYLYWGYLQERNCVSVHDILKIMNFLKKLYICTFCVIHAQDTNFIFVTPQTYTCICTDTQRHAHTYAETPAHRDRYT